MRPIPSLPIHLFSLLLFSLTPWVRSEDAVDRITKDRLSALRRGIEELQKSRVEPHVVREYRDFRANLHVHSAFSHDSRGTIDEIIAAAKRAGTSILMFNEHPADHYDFFQDGHRGLRDGVLLIPGAEMKGFLTFPKQSLQAFSKAEGQEFSDIVRGRGGHLFLSHLEERMDWTIQGISGCEIYNTHADFKDEKRLVSSLKNPLWLIQAQELFHAYPQEALSSLLDYPSEYLKRWDELCQIAPHTGVSANDAHQNVGLIIRLAEGNRVRIEDPLGEILLELDAKVYAALRPIPADTKVGSELFRLQLDPYEKSLRHVGTHLLLKELSSEEVWDALDRGRAFVAFDWMADSTGFDCSLRWKERRWEIGSQVPWKESMTLQADSPHSVEWRWMCDGKMIEESSGFQSSCKVDHPGVYRVEAWLTMNGRKQIWILSNPFYLQRGSNE